MSAHCGHDDNNFDGASPAFRRALWWVVGINATMFVIEMTAGVAGRSQALQADALDFAGDTATYLLSLLVIGHSLKWRARAALLKGLSLAAMGVFVLGATFYRIIVLGLPSAPIMGGIAVMALVANLTSVALLMKYRDGDANVRSVWLCSRNDAIGNVAVMIAAVAVWWWVSPWPDLIVAAGMALLFLSGAVSIIRQANAELRHVSAAEVAAE